MQLFTEGFFGGVASNTVSCRIHVGQAAINIDHKQATTGNICYGFGDQ